MKLPETLTDMRRYWVGPNVVLGLCLGTALALPCVAEEDSVVPLSDKSLRTLDFGFRNGKWATPYTFEPCSTPCTSSFHPNSIHADPNPALPYKHDFSFSIGQSGPLSFRVSGSRLRMKVEF